MKDALSQLHKEHQERQVARTKIRAPIFLVTALIMAASVGAWHLRWPRSHFQAGLCLGTGIILAALWAMSAQLLAEWDRAIVLRMGQFRAVKGPGFFPIVPFIDSVMRVVDMRIRTTAFYSEAMLTKDTVPVGIDAIAFWHVWDPKKALLEVESYYNAIVLAVQTALRDIVGVHTLAEILGEREKLSRTLQEVLRAKTEAWGITVTGIEIRDLTIPEGLKDALSKQAQAERERQARAILGQAEKEIAEKFVAAANCYAGDPVAIQLRAMNILYEGMRAGATLMLVPSSALDMMNLGGVAALGLQHQRAGGKEAKAGEKAPQD